MSEAPGAYTFAARVTVGFDGGNHNRYGDLVECDRCGALVLPAGVRKHDEFHAALDGARPAGAESGDGPAAADRKQQR